MTILEKAVATVSAITVIGGGAWALGQPPYANRQWTMEQIAVLQEQVSHSRLNQLDSQIIYWQGIETQRKLTQQESELLLRLKRERQILVCQLKIEKC